MGSVIGNFGGGLLVAAAIAFMVADFRSRVKGSITR